MLLDMFFTHMVTLFLILLFSIKLLSKKSFRNTEIKYFWITVLSCLLLVFEDSLETFTASDPSLIYWRILLSVLGYTLRSVSALSLLLVIYPSKKYHFVLWIPSVITLLTCSTAFFTDWAFGFGEDYGFYRGPLGYVAFVVPLIYIAAILFIIFRRFSERKGLEKFILPLCVVFCIAATVAGVISGGTRLNEAIMISAIFFYIVLYSHDNRHDPLTGLLNRQSFYDDCASYGSSISAVASLDMNGLKTLNDVHGHRAGDNALKKIGSCLNAVTDHNISAYRTGGDEFIILFLHTDEKKVAETVKCVKDSVEKCGCSISAGYAVREDNGKSLDETISESDRLMYEDKDNYYRINGIDRRRKHEPAEEKHTT